MWESGKKRFFKFQAATLFLGANDANDPKINPWQAVPVEEYKVFKNSMFPIVVKFL